MKRICSICSSPVAKEINKALVAHEKLRDLESRWGFSRSSFSRHLRKCIPIQTIIANTKLRKVNMTGRRIVVLWPDGSLTVAHDPDGCEQRLDCNQSRKVIASRDVRETDVLIHVLYDQPPIRKPVVDPKIS